MPAAAKRPRRTRTRHASVGLTLGCAQVGTGKTSLVRQYVHQTFSNNYKSTIGAPSRPAPTLRKRVQA